ncbi:SIR2 family NAD-dependent protein deacylase [Telluria beijingensis]|uniref:SIR2 family NAD-dependent protein deacylase n=1 Tax=Telluria beijingensis TaxID=3068633 RepID=UPI002796181C|nr:Sir2 family NAD-dependent protein deacetylase [Massilia sp. REN29]
MENVVRACTLVDNADGLLIAAGAGIGVDSGLPDFRGNAGFWKAYPPLAERGLPFREMANPASFARDPRLAWGFYGHRLDLYRRTRPHAGFAILRALGERMRHGSFVFTSNVDGQFQRAGFAPDRIAECHGTIHHLQCSRPCRDTTWPADGFAPEVDLARCTLLSPLPGCPHCGALARPNILMFNDMAWVDVPSDAQLMRLERWRTGVERLAVIELGAGTDLPSVRRFTESHGVPAIRINPREHRIVRGVGLAMGALAAMQAIAQEMSIDVS